MKPTDILESIDPNFFNSCTTWEYVAAERLAGQKDTNANLVLAASGLRHEMMTRVHDYSHAASLTDQLRLDKASEHVQRLALAQEQRCLDRMVEPQPLNAALMSRLMAELEKRGVDVRDLDHLRVLIRSHRSFQRAWDKYPDQREFNQPYWDRVKEELQKAKVI